MSGTRRESEREREKRWRRGCDASGARRSLRDTAARALAATQKVTKKEVIRFGNDVLEIERIVPVSELLHPEGVPKARKDKDALERTYAAQLRRLEEQTKSASQEEKAKLQEEMAKLQRDLDGKLQDAARQVRREGGPKKQIDVCVNVDENLISLVVPPLGTRTRQ